MAQSRRNNCRCDGLIPQPKIEAQSKTWYALKEYYTARLDELRRKNDVTSTVEVTEKIRGQIAEIKHLLAIEKLTGD